MAFLFLFIGVASSIILLKVGERNEKISVIVFPFLMLLAAAVYKYVVG